MRPHAGGIVTLMRSKPALPNEMRVSIGGEDRRRKEQVAPDGRLDHVRACSVHPAQKPLTGIEHLLTYST